MEPTDQSRVAGKARETLSKVLEHVLQDESFLLAATRDYLRRVTGPNSYSLHRLFDEQRRQLDYWFNRVLEQTKSIGLGALSLVEKDARLPRLDADTSERLPPARIIGDLISSHETLAHRLRGDIVRLPDPAVADVLLHLAEFHETSAWMLRMVQTGSDSSHAD